VATIPGSSWAKAVVRAVLSAIRVAAMLLCPRELAPKAQFTTSLGASSQDWWNPKTPALKVRFSSVDSLRSRGSRGAGEAVCCTEQSTSSVQRVLPQPRRRADPQFGRSEKIQKF